MALPRRWAEKIIPPCPWRRFLIDYKEACEYFNISVDQLNRWRRMGRIRAYHHETPSGWMFFYRYDHLKQDLSVHWPYGLREDKPYAERPKLRAQEICLVGCPLHRYRDEGILPQVLEEMKAEFCRTWVPPERRL